MTEGQITIGEWSILNTETEKMSKTYQKSTQVTQEHCIECHHISKTKTAIGMPV